MRFSILAIAFLSLHVYSIAQGVSAQTLAQLEEIKIGYQFPNDAWLIADNGDTLSFESLKGQWTIMDYWSAGCKPCIEAFPFLKSLHEEDSLLQVIAINVDKDFARFRKYHSRYNVGYPNYYAGFTLSNPFMLANLKVVNDGEKPSRLVTLTPQYLLINPDGIIVSDSLPKPGTTEFETALKMFIK